MPSPGPYPRLGGNLVGAGPGTLPEGASSKLYAPLVRELTRSRIVEIGAYELVSVSPETHAPLRGSPPDRMPSTFPSASVNSGPPLSPRRAQMRTLIMLPLPVTSPQWV